MEPTGYVSTIYDTGNYKLHHDYIFDTNHNLLVLATKKEAQTSEDKIIMIERNSGNITELVDLIDLLPNYYSTTSLPDDAEDLDWMHINSLALVDKTSLIISSRETSTIIKLDNIYSNPTIDYMIGLRSVLPDAKIIKSAYRSKNRCKCCGNVLDFFRFFLCLLF